MAPRRHFIARLGPLPFRLQRLVDPVPDMFPPDVIPPDVILPDDAELERAWAFVEAWSTPNISPSLSPLISSDESETPLEPLVVLEEGEGPLMGDPMLSDAAAPSGGDEDEAPSPEAAAAANGPPHLEQVRNFNCLKAWNSAFIKFNLGPIV